MSVQLHIETTGRGPDLFLLHGLALHSRVWDCVRPDLVRDWRVTCADLPGHGRSRELALPATLADAASVVVRSAPANAVWLGWSFGGLVALRAALDFPAAVRALVLVNSAPRFLRGADWPSGMTPRRLAEFARDLQHDYRNTVQDFLALQVQGAERVPDALRQLRALLLAGGEPDAASLAAGFEILRHADLRAEIPQLTLPVLVIAGGRDRLVPPQAARATSGMLRNPRLVEFPHAAHAPFLSQPREFAAALRKFLAELPDAQGAPVAEAPARG